MRSPSVYRPAPTVDGGTASVELTARVPPRPLPTHGPPMEDPTAPAGAGRLRVPWCRVPPPPSSGPPFTRTDATPRERRGSGPGPPSVTIPLSVPGGIDFG